jgi:hypothetical protein
MFNLPCVHVDRNAGHHIQDQPTTPVLSDISKFRPPFLQSPPPIPPHSSTILCTRTNNLSTDRYTYLGPPQIPTPTQPPSPAPLAPRPSPQDTYTCHTAITRQSPIPNSRSPDEESNRSPGQVYPWRTCNLPFKLNSTEFWDQIVHDPPKATPG